MNPSGLMTGSVHRLKGLLPLLVLLTAACDDPFGPRSWSDVPDTVTIYSASRAEYAGFGSVVDVTAVPVAVLPLEAQGLAGNWDFTVTDLNGGLALTPSSAFPALESRARVHVVTAATLADVTQAPRDTTLYTANAVPISAGDVYVVRSRRSGCGLSSSGYRYAKLRPVEIDVQRGTFRFEIVRNPYCDDRSFVPPED